MKRLIYGVALIGIASVGLAFMSKETKGDDPYCIEIQCKGNRWRETINAFSATKARQIAQSKYPNCKTVSFGKGACK